MKAFFTFLQKVTGSALFYPVRNLSGNTFGVTLSRLKRLRTILRSMVEQPLIVNAFPVRLQIETINACNFRCKMCARVSLGQQPFAEISLGSFIEIIKEITPYYVTLNGLGEPFLDKTILRKIKFLVKNDIMVSMPSNGSLIKELIDCVENEAFPDILQFSIDGATKESFEAIRAGSNFEAVVENYRTILQDHQAEKKRYGSQIRILCALQKKNFFEFQEMFALLTSLNAVGIFCLVPVYDFSPETKKFASEIPDSDDVEVLNHVITPKIQSAKTPMEKAFYENWLQCARAFEKPGQPKINKEARTRCLIPWFNAYIAANGDVLPCCYLLGRSNHVMGNVLRQPFNEIWNGNRFTAFRKNLLKNRSALPGCATCPRNDLLLQKKLETVNQFLSWLFL